MAVLTPTNLSPNVANYYIGRGQVFWARDGAGERDMGNCPVFQLKPAIKNLDHFASNKGLKLKDRSVALEANMTVIIHFEEWTADNLALALMGQEGGGAVDIMSLAEITGSIRFQGNNDVGPKVSILLPIVSITPTGTMDIISKDTWGEVELTGDVLADPTAATPSFGTMTWSAT